SPSLGWPFAASSLRSKPARVNRAMRDFAQRDRDRPDLAIGRLERDRRICVGGARREARNAAIAPVRALPIPNSGFGGLIGEGNAAGPFLRERVGLRAGPQAGPRRTREEAAMGLAERTAPTAEEYAGYRKRFSNWGRWGADDELGTLNFITPAARRSAAALVR